MPTYRQNFSSVTNFIAISSSCSSYLGIQRRAPPSVAGTTVDLFSSVVVEIATFSFMSQRPYKRGGPFMKVLAWTKSTGAPANGNSRLKRQVAAAAVTGGAAEEEGGSWATCGGGCWFHI
ncbi:unnamed protein product [Citrullus colocynthis]|uniref:Uncharacterized protein n=1 Tax=Citrullus colocynthis TaxID=252529 RepID=A0ABP0YCZ2_9ROSI